MQQLYSQLLDPSANEGRGPSMLAKRAANAIQTMFGINQTNCQLLGKLQNDLVELTDRLQQQTAALAAASEEVAKFAELTKTPVEEPDESNQSSDVVRDERPSVPTIS